MNILNQLMFNDSIFDGFIPSYGTSGSWDLIKNENGSTLTIAVVGLSKSDIEIDIEGTTLHVHGKKEVGSTKYVVNKRFNLENIDIDYDNISAKCENGILEINLPTPEEMLPRKKSVKIS